jgi:molybdate transport system substrate-binding protein
MAVRRAHRLLAPLALLTLLAAGALGGCGDGGDGDRRAVLTVSAATSLKGALSASAGAFAPARVRFSFAGSDQLAAQIRQGAAPDVYAAANARLPAQLFAEGLVERPVAFAGNELVVAVPADGSPVRRLSDLARPGVRIAAGAASVPVGAYTREVIARLPAAQAAAVRRNVRSAEPDVAGVVGKLTQGAVDAGFLYATDVRAAGGRLRVVRLPAGLRPRVRYAAAVVKGTREPRAARAYVASLRGGAAARALAQAGFLPAPRAAGP